ncbi:hypothetical protein ACFP56_01875 [Paenibacillus septentrionalis]|uniref:DUF3426 domain-containing protein n=1 Tax=Paenibacillus septentrionalis TaxID=429342 RepID=A0ABW1UYP4_9BACL
MSNSTTSLESESVTLDDKNISLSFSGLELEQDAHSVIVKMVMTNCSAQEQVISSQYFVIADDIRVMYPQASYLSEPSKPGMLWSWKRLMPGEICTIIMRYDLVGKVKQYELKMIYRNHEYPIKRFYQPS